MRVLVVLCSVLAVGVAADNAVWTPQICTCMGSGHASLTLRSDWRNHLLETKTDIPTLQYVRFHGILDDDMSVVLRDGYSFFNVFSTMDFLVANGLKPVLEVSFMPELLASGTATVMHYKGNVTPPKNYSDWVALISTLFSALVERYGETEISSWRVEVWNEPDGSTFWSGTQAEYFKLYNVTAHAIMSTSASWAVGGPATSQLKWLPAFINYTSTAPAPVSYVSSHLYPSDPETNKTRLGFYQYIAAAAATTKAAKLPFVLTEFNAGLDLGVSGQDTEYAASFVLHNAVLLQSVPELQFLSWWTFSDIFEEQGFQSKPFHGGFGLRTVTNVPKPAFRVMQWLSEASGHKVVQSFGASLTTTVTGTVLLNSTHCTVLVTNYQYKAQPIAPRTASVVVDLPCAVPATGTAERVDAMHGSAIHTWLAQGSPEYPTAAQTAAQLAASQVAAEPIDIGVPSKTTANVSIFLPILGSARVQFACPN